MTQGAPRATATSMPAVPSLVIAMALLRPVGVIATTLLFYSLFPIDGVAAPVAVATMAGIGLVGILVVFARQMSRVSRADRPIVAALEAVCLVFGMFIVLFALLYGAISQGNPDAFTQEIDKVSGIYFTMTVLATVGFGDISAVSDPARILVTIQMVLGMVLIGTAFKALSFTARSAVSAQGQHKVAEIESLVEPIVDPASPAAPGSVDRTADGTSGG